MNGCLFVNNTPTYTYIHTYSSFVGESQCVLNLVVGTEDVKVLGVSGFINDANEDDGTVIHHIEYEDKG